jgi:hypothetical protein
MLVEISKVCQALNLTKQRVGQFVDEGLPRDWRRDSRMIADEGTVIGCVGHPDDLAEFQQAMRKSGAGEDHGSRRARGGVRKSGVEEMIENHPLYWPEGWKRTPRSARRHLPADVAFGRARDRLLRELARLARRRSSSRPTSRSAGTGCPTPTAASPTIPASLCISTIAASRCVSPPTRHGA